jgi:predicted CXXCH cytochrome family protein
MGLRAFRAGVLVPLLALGAAGATAAAPAATPAPRAPAATATTNPYHLKPGARGTLCLQCHVTFQETVKLPFVHTPVKKGACVDCHSPHASSHGKLLAAEPGAICSGCHGGLLPSAPRSVHPPVAAGDCVKCHDPHGARNKANLKVAGNDLCKSCHADLLARIAGHRFKHAPVTQGCLGCHDPHASGSAPHLLKKDVPALCTGCHRTDQPVFARQHLNYPVAKGRCTSCHDPHGSDNGALLWPTVHPPLLSKMCGQCHLDPASPNALNVKKQGFELCRGCHSGLVNETLSRNRVHWPVLDKVGCLHCHSPHASPEKALLLKPTKALCGGCHADTIARQASSATKHPPVDEGECATCHQPHASDNVFLLQDADPIVLCQTCHNYDRHSTHPIGAKVVDPRNRNLTVDCLSCHRAHGSPNKALGNFDTQAELCVQCHQDVRR